jgi:hypothetical protein
VKRVGEHSIYSTVSYAPSDRVVRDWFPFAVGELALVRKGGKLKTPGNRKARKRLGRRGTVACAFMIVKICGPGPRQRKNRGLGVSCYVEDRKGLRWLVALADLQQMTPLEMLSMTGGGTDGA